MHMADALLSPAVGLGMGAVSAAAVGVTAAMGKRDDFSEGKIPLMGVAGALVFAGQMVNFTIPATGSSGHIVGSVLLSALIGGGPAFLAMTAVLTIQCLFFADGGLLALGCNIFNMGVIPCLVVCPLVFRPLLRGGVSNRRLSAASVVSSVLSLELAALAVTLLTFLSGIAGLPFAAFASLMLPIHLVIGLVEGVVTAAILVFVHRMRPELIDASAPLSGRRREGRSAKKVLISLAVLAIASGCALSLFASTHPDGLEWAVGKTAERAQGQGQADGQGEVQGEADGQAQGEGEGEGTELVAQGNNNSGLHDDAAALRDSTAFLPGYVFAADPENEAGVVVSGLVGTLAVFAASCAVGLVMIPLVKYRKKSVSDAGP
ncbi:MAG: energy-coupling factor ABC transporter permease [Oscillospiraceae bacterium]|nr:energy-coupling factor ABC transporter permease [Oscillospiraceae bacterium]